MLTVNQFEQILAARVLLGKMSRQNYTHPSYELLFSNVFYTLNEILRDYGFGKTAWAIRRGRRLYLLHPQTRRIICEIGVIAEPAAEFRVVTLRGLVPATETLESLIQATADRGARRSTYKLERKERSDE